MILNGSILNKKLVITNLKNPKLFDSFKIVYRTKNENRHGNSRVLIPWQHNQHMKRVKK